MQFILTIIGYLAVATLLSAGLLLGYLWNTDRLNDEKAFRIVALIHDIELDPAHDEDGQIVVADTPDEEPSMADIQRVRELALRNFEVKQNAIDRGKSEYEHILTQLVAASRRIDGMASEFEKRVQQESELAGQQNVSNVVRDLVSVKPERAKELLLLNFKEAGNDPGARQKAMDDVIRLMNAMPSNNLKNILKRYQTPEEIRILHEIHTEMLDGGPKKKVFDEALDQIKNRDFGA